MKLRANIAQNLNTITRMDASVLASYNTDITYANAEILKRVQVGNALGGIYGFKFKGVYAYDYDHNGYFQDINGEANPKTIGPTSMATPTLLQATWMLANG